MKIFADTSDISEMLKVSDIVSGFTTNPTLMRKAGINDYLEFIRQVKSNISLPISLEVIADDIPIMGEQARKLASYSDNFYIKIPITNTKGQSTADLITQLNQEGIKINITAVFTYDQINEAIKSITTSTPSIISVFAGRIADTQIDPKSLIYYAKHKSSYDDSKQIEILWASCREIYNMSEAEAIGCNIITVPPDMLLKSRQLFRKDLTEFSLETVKMFYHDAISSGLTL